VRIWEDYLREHPRAERLPPILPTVVYHGDSAWTSRLTLVELIDLDTAMSKLLAPYIPNFGFRLDDLSSARAEDLRARAMTAMSQLALFCLSRARKSGDVAAELEAAWQDRMREVAEAPNGVAALATVLRYVLEASETPPERVRNLVRQLGPKAEEAYMTGAQILRAEGEAKGRAEGEAKGRAEGKAEGEAKGKAEVLLKLLELKFGAMNAATLERVRAAKVEELDRWVERVITAASLDDVFVS
jgi:Putative transposase, YhgA-like